jgi:hypothetical protein
MWISEGVICGDVCCVMLDIFDPPREMRVVGMDESWENKVVA